MKRFDTRHLVGRSLTLACGLAVAIASPVWSATDSNDYPKVLHDMVDAGKIQVGRQFTTDKSGMTGYIVKRNGYQTVVYSEDGFLMLGPLYNPQGHNMSKQYARQYAPKPDVSKIIDGLDRKRVITQGPAGAPALYVFADPNCIFCHKLYQQIKPLVSAGKLRIHWILVGILGPRSIDRAVTILEAEDPAAAWVKNEAHFDVANEQGGVAVGKPSATLGDVLSKNRQAMFMLGSRGTPTIVYADEQGRLQAHQGMPSNGWLAQYAQD